MAVYDSNGVALSAIYDNNGTSLQYAYNKDGTEIFSGTEPEEPFIKTTLTYDTNWFINSAWLANATIQRDRIKTIYQQSEDAIPFFIQTDGHGRYNEGNKGCHNLAEPIMRYMPNIQLGDYGSYYSDGNNPANHARTSLGITNYISAMGNHEFMKSTAEGSLIPDLPTLIASYTPPNGILGSQTYGYYKVLDDKYNIKWLVGQEYVPDATNSSGFVRNATDEQWQWFISEMASNDGYDIIVLNHAPFGGTYYRIATDDYVTYGGTNGRNDFAPLLSARKAKQSGTHTISDGTTFTYDFTNCTSDLLTVFHGHTHKISTMEKSYHGYPAFIGRDMTNSGDCAYGIIDRFNGKLYIFTFNKSSADEALVLDL